MGVSAETSFICFPEEFRRTEKRAKLPLRKTRKTRKTGKRGDWISDSSESTIEGLRGVGAAFASNGWGGLLHMVILSFWGVVICLGNIRSTDV